MAFETTAARIWKRLSREERHRAAAWFWREPPDAVVGAALAAIVKARHLRPQVARALPVEAQAAALGSVLDADEALASSLLVALHLGERRAMLAAFLDVLGLAHDNGILKDDAGPLSGAEALRQGVQALAARFPRREVETYLNTLWVQDPERWGDLEKSPDWMAASA